MNFVLQANTSQPAAQTQAACGSEANISVTAARTLVASGPFVDVSQFEVLVVIKVVVYFVLKVAFSIEHLNYSSIYKLLFNQS